MPKVDPLSKFDSRPFKGLARGCIIDLRSLFKGRPDIEVHLRSLLEM
jgi:hypothetical protein